MVRRSSATSRGTTYLFQYFLFSCVPSISFVNVQVCGTRVLTITKRKTYQRNEGNDNVVPKVRMHAASNTVAVKPGKIFKKTIFCSLRFTLTEYLRTLRARLDRHAAREEHRKPACPSLAQKWSNYTHTRWTQRTCDSALNRDFRRDASWRVHFARCLILRLSFSLLSVIISLKFNLMHGHLPRKDKRQRRLSKKSEMTFV